MLQTGWFPKSYVKVLATSTASPPAQAPEWVLAVIKPKRFNLIT